MPQRPSLREMMGGQSHRAGRHRPGQWDRDVEISAGQTGGRAVHRSIPPHTPHGSTGRSEERAPDSHTRPALPGIFHRDLLLPLQSRQKRLGTIPLSHRREGLQRPAGQGRGGTLDWLQQSRRVFRQRLLRQALQVTVRRGWARWHRRAADHVTPCRAPSRWKR